MPTVTRTRTASDTRIPSLLRHALRPDSDIATVRQSQNQLLASPCLKLKVDASSTADTSKFEHAG